jgi:predicted DNA-binding transcriptional regulator YafY
MVLRILNRLDRLDYFIGRQSTGTADELAQKLGISRRQLYNYLDEMKVLGVEVEYDRFAKTYRYKGNMRLKISVRAEMLSPCEAVSVNGGGYIHKNFSPVQL